MSAFSSEAIQSLLPRIKALPRDASRTHLPTILPLAFPSSLHTLNTLATIHVIHAILSRPSHSSYFAETDSNPADTALAGVLGMYLSSSEDWTSSNLLSQAAWKAGKMDENLISEMFRIETTKEKEHETMKGIRVGGRWDPGARIVEELKDWFGSAAGILGQHKCVGDWVGMVIKDSWAEGDDIGTFVKNCCEWATGGCPALKDIYESSTDADVLPFAPLRLIYDLSTRQAASDDLDLQLPDPAQLDNISPLPLSVAAAICSGLIQSPSILDSIGQSSTSGTSQRTELSFSEYKNLVAQTVQASRAIKEAGGTDGPSYLDIHLYFRSLETLAEKEGNKLIIVADKE